MKWADLVSLSITTQIVSWFYCDRRKPTTKPMVMCSYFHSGIGSGCNNPYSFQYPALTYWQVRPLVTCSAVDTLILTNAIERRGFYLWKIYNEYALSIIKILIRISILNRRFIQKDQKFLLQVILYTLNFKRV